MNSIRGSINSGYVVSIPAILKYAEIVSSILTFAIAAGGGPDFQYNGGGWVVFTGVLGFLVALAFFIMYLFSAYPDVLITYMVEPITNGVLAIFYFISGIVAAVFSSKENYHGYRGQHEAGAASFFAFLSMVLFAVDAVIVFINNRSAGPRTTTTTTTTTNNPNVPPEYASQNAVY